LHSIVRGKDFAEKKATIKLTVQVFASGGTNVEKLTIAGNIKKEPAKKCV
jgi:hypothetical protein